MISSFSSFVEFFAAIYVTMAVNNDFCSNFWIPQYYKEMDLLLKTYDFSGSSSIHDKLMSEIKAKYDIVQNHAHFRGFILLTLCVFYLIFMGYEDQNNCHSVNHNVPILYCTVLVGITLLFSSKILVTWKWTIIMVFVYFLFYVILKIGNWQTLADSDVSLFLFEYKSILLIGIIILPIIYQIFVYWLHSSIYKGYLKYHVAEEYNRFRKSMAGIKTKNKSMVDKIYMDAWTDAAFNSSEDPTLTNFYNVLNEQLLLIASPSYWQLFSSWGMHCFHKLRRKNDQTSGPAIDIYAIQEVFPQATVSIQSESSNKSALDFTDEYQQYCKWKKTAGKNSSVKTYCTSKGISSKDMIAWLRVNKPDKTK